jgi:hypothetical protein
MKLSVTDDIKKIGEIKETRCPNCERTISLSVYILYLCDAKLRIFGFVIKREYITACNIYNNCLRRVLHRQGGIQSRRFPGGGNRRERPLQAVQKR